MWLDLYKNNIKNQFHSKKHSFTLIEVLLVLILLIIIFSITRRMFFNNNQIIIESQACMQSLQWKLSKFIVDAATWKWMSSPNSGSLVFPNIFTIDISQSNQLISLNYWSWENYDTIYFTGQNTQDLCNSNLHYIKLNSDNIQITIQKHLESQFWTPAITIQRNWIINNENTIDIPFQFCRYNVSWNELCNDFYNINFDRRNQLLTENTCKVFTTWCIKRSNN